MTRITLEEPAVSQIQAAIENKEFVEFLDQAGRVVLRTTASSPDVKRSSPLSLEELEKRRQETASISSEELLARLRAMK